MKLLRYPAVFVLALFTAGMASVVQAEGHAAETTSMTSVERAFDDVMFDLENAIINQGLVIDYIGKVGDMLSRTADAVESQSPYADARYIQFCSAPLTHQAVEIDPRNLSICPYVVFGYELSDQPGVTHVGFRNPQSAGDEPAAAEAMQAIVDLLQSIVDEATSG